MEIRKILPVILILSCSLPVYAAQDLTLLVTSNLGGRFTSDTRDQEQNDPMVVMAQSILAERSGGRVDLYIDLGNAFSPGMLSRFSYGAVVMDFLDLLSCDATLVSSGDTAIGITSLGYLREGHRAALLSASIAESGRPMFTPFILVKKENAVLAFIGISSRKVRVDITEKKVHPVTVEDPGRALQARIGEALKAGATHLVLVTGLSVTETVSLMKEFPSLSMAMCGGDNNGEIQGGMASRIDLADGRSIMVFTGRDCYHSLGLRVDRGIKVTGFERRVPSAHATTERPYRDFLTRLSLWKNQFRSEEETIGPSLGNESWILDDRDLGYLMQCRYGAEVALLDRDTIGRRTLTGEVRKSDIQDMVNLNYNVFVFSMTGAELSTLSSSATDLSLWGLSDGKVQGYPLVPNRRYRVAATQSAWERSSVILGTEPEYVNTWNTVYDIVKNDMAGERLLLKGNRETPDRTMRTTLDLYLSNFVDRASVKNSGNSAPPGMPSQTYTRWGIESRADITVYNRYHTLVFTPMIHFVKQDSTPEQNLLRGIFLYNLNVHDRVKPYHKSQCDTVVVKSDTGRPVLLRETAGALFTFLQWKGSYLVSGKTGLGFEKKLHDPEEDPLLGFELIGVLTVPLYTRLVYELDVDSFITTQKGSGTGNTVRAEVENSLRFHFKPYLAVSFRHQYFVYHEGETSITYTDSRFMTSLDVRTNFKIW